MGAIVGVLRGPGRGTNEPELQAMLKRIEHRGRYGTALWTNNNLGLGHLSDGVQPSISPTPQPYTSPDERYRVVCSGRIFNWQEIGASLHADTRAKFATNSCIATMLAAYVERGTAVFAQFNGSFACAIWDELEKSLLLVRDHFGMRPLYYAEVGGGVAFASEIKALHCLPEIAVEPNPVGIFEYMSVNRFLLLTDQTCYAKVKKLLPGTWLKVSEQGRTEGRYWDIDPNAVRSYSSDEERIANVRELMVDSIGRRIPDGDKVGSALSGGFDSSSIVCVARDLLDKQGRKDTNIDTFSFNFDTPEADELDLIELVAKHARTDHHAVQVLQPALFDDLDNVILANDAPVVESTALFLYKKMRRIGETGLSVQFSGIGGDELFQGEFNYFSDLLRRGRWGELYSEVTSVYPHDPITGRSTELWPMLRAFALSPLRPSWYQKMRGTSNGIAYPPDWINPSFLASTGVDRNIPDPPRPRFSDVYDQSCWDLFYYELCGASVHYHDCAGAEFGVESRYPLMDVRLVEEMFATGREWKIRRGKVRPMQKAAMEPYLPLEIRQDHLKKDHHPTVTKFIQKVLRERIGNLVHGENQMAREYMDWEALERHARPFLEGKSYNPLPLWIALALERWLQLSFGDKK